MEYQAALRFVCSERRYHICTSAMKVGATEASKDPRMNLAAIKPPKSLAAVMPQSVAPSNRSVRAQAVLEGCYSPQQNTISPQNLPSGSLTKKYAMSGCQTSCATYTIAPDQLYS